MRAIKRVDTEGVPNRRKARRWAVAFNKKKYPCKLLISWANVYANGEALDPNPNNFVTYDAQDYLIQKGFEIIEI